MQLLVDFKLIFKKGRLSRDEKKRRSRILLIVGLLTSGIIFGLIFTGVQLWNNRAPTHYERPANSIVRIKPGDRHQYDLTIYEDSVSISLFNQSDFTLDLNLAAIEANVEFTHMLSDEYFGSHTEISAIMITFTMQTGYAAGVDVRDGVADILISAGGFFEMGDLPENGLSVEGSIASVLLDEIANMSASNLGTEGNFLGGTSTLGMNAHEREEVFSHGLRVAMGSIYNNRFMLTNIPALYNSIYVVSLGMFTMNPVYFRDNRTFQEGIAISLDEFTQLVNIFLREGPMVVEENEVQLWRR